MAIFFRPSSRVRRLAVFFVLALAALFSQPRSVSRGQDRSPTDLYLPLVFGPGAAPGPQIAGCPLQPRDNIWNTRVDGLPLHPRSNAYIASIGSDTSLHPDFGTTWQGSPIGIPYTTVPGDRTKVAVTFEYDDESDPGPYPIPPNPPIEAGSDHHILIVDRDQCILYELFGAYLQNGHWYAGSGAIFDLRANGLRPAGWTSADAAGLPILPGLVRYEEVTAREIRHAIRFTAARTQKAYIWPARHYASSNTDPNVPPMGQRFRLKASFDISGFSAEVQVVLKAMQLYGIILADNGSNWYISGSPDARWNDDVLVNEFRQIHGSDFEAVDVASLMIDPDSGQARQTP